ncbi:HNH endonuclease family protein, partial [uncultured Corynebacterium sp.]|uniref:HNH endonuclease family protein n=1 Tax=uncultured Corynebacterium sp. TaxID=159447 RepID=UPI0025DB98FD
MRNIFRTVAGFSAAVLAASALVACSSEEDGTGSAVTTVTSLSEVVTSPAGAPAAEGSVDDGGSGDAAASSDDDVAAALATLDTLAVKGRAPKTGYDRALFGQAWADVDRNGCDTRNDILARDLTDVVFKKGSCRVLSGILDDPYTGRTINFVRGQDTSTAVQIDHLVALSDAWQKGAQQLSPERREQLANDPANLLAVDGPANMQKRDGDAATWLPANKSFRCTYVSKQIDVKAAYALWVTQAEKDAM